MNAGRTAASELLAAASLPDDERLTIDGTDPVIRTPFRVGTAASAAQGAIGVAVSELWKQQTGREQTVHVDLRAAAIALRGRQCTFIDGKKLGTLDAYDPWDDDARPKGMYYPARDGQFIRLQMGFANLQDVALRTLGNPRNVDEAMEASSRWDGCELEEAIHAAGGCAGFVRSAAEWNDHPQSAAVAAQPLFEIVQIGEAAPELPRASSRPLSGIRVLDLTRVVAGPACSRTLAEHGADVLKVNAPHLPNMGAGEFDSGIGKLSTFLDLRQSEDAGTLRKLVRDADVFSQSYRPGSMANRGFSPEQLAALRPGIVYVELSAWGNTGPWSGRRGYDPTVQSVSGMALIQGGGREPEKIPVSAIDFVTGYFMALGVIAALERRARIGGSWLVRTSLARAGKWIGDQGILDAGTIAGLPSEPPADEVARLSTDTSTSIGLLRHMRPVVQMSETPAFWARPPVPLGSSPALWPARETASVR